MKTWFSICKIKMVQYYRFWRDDTITEACCMLCYGGEISQKKQYSTESR